MKRIITYVKLQRPADMVSRSITGMACVTILESLVSRDFIMGLRARSLMVSAAITRIGQMLEQGLEQKIVSKIKSKNGMCFKWVSPGFTGVPDRIAILPGGRVIFIEVKRPGLKDGRSPRQKRVAQQLEDLGCTVLKVNKMEDLDGYL